MKAEARQRVLWGVLFAFSAVGPYGLDAREGIATPAASGTYAFVALGMLAGLWATQYPGVAARCRRPAVWKLCVYGGLLLAAFLSVLGVYDAVATQVARPIQTGGARGWAANLLTLVSAVGTHERALAFVAAFACGASSTRLAGNLPAGCPAPHGVAGCLVVAAAFIAGLLRTSAWSVLLPSLLGILLLWGCLVEWSLCIARYGSLRGCIAALCLGELAYRLLGRFGLSFPSGGYGFEDVALLASAICLVASVVASRSLPHRSLSPEHPAQPEAGTQGVASLETWERQRLQDAGLTDRELTVLTATIGGHDSSEVAKRLGLQPSTVRTYKGRICKKLGADTFDRILTDRSAKTGLFGPPGTKDSTNEVPRHAAVAPLMCLTGCLSLLFLLLMPYGTLPSFWNTTWVMAYGCAAGILASCIPAFLHRMGPRCRSGFVSSVVVRTAFCACATACLLIHYAMELGATGFTVSQQIALFFSVAGLVCFGFTELRRHVGPAQPKTDALGAACAGTALLATVPSLDGSLWYGTVAVALLVYVIGAVVQKRGAAEKPSNPKATHPAIAASWFAMAFVWEECWRGVVYASLQDIGIPFLVVLSLIDTAVLLKRGIGSRVACAITLTATVILCIAKGPVFGLLVGAVLLEVQALQARPATRRTSDAPREAASVPCAPPALLGAAVGCGTAVYVANTRGTYMLLHASSILPPALDWTVLACFAVSLAIAVWRALLILLSPGTPASAPPPVDQTRLEGYLIGKGLTPDEVRVCVALARGDSVAQAANALSYSVSAVGAAKRGAFVKLGVSNRYQYMASLWSEFSPKQDQRFQ